MFSIDWFNAEYETNIIEVLINDKRFEFYMPASIERFVDSDDALKDFPLWAKMWEASGLLADFLSKITPEPDQKALELGAGLGVVGIVAAAFGHNVTMTEYNEDALHFARANAVLNHSKNLNITKLDWNNPEVAGQFDLIVGSEIIYKRNDIDKIYHLLCRYLKPGGRVILAEAMRATGYEFYQSMSSYFHIKANKKVMRSDNEEIPIVLMQLKWKDKALED